jgi:tryptophan-rich sensory protein
MIPEAQLPAAPATSPPAAGAVPPPAKPRPYAALALAGWLLLCYAVAAAGSYSTASAIPSWYAGLAKPALNPPNWVFAPVWTLLYTAMAVAVWLAWRTRPSGCRVRAIRLFLVQLLLNLTWTWVFFGQHRPGLALIEIALLWVAIALTAQAFRIISYKAFWLMMPYLAWVSFAAYLNWGIWRLNR